MAMSCSEAQTIAHAPEAFSREPKTVGRAHMHMLECEQCMTALERVNNGFMRDIRNELVRRQPERRGKVAMPKGEEFDF